MGCRTFCVEPVLEARIHVEEEIVTTKTLQSGAYLTRGWYTGIIVRSRTTWVLGSVAGGGKTGWAGLRGRLFFSRLTVGWNEAFQGSAVLCPSRCLIRALYALPPELILFTVLRLRYVGISAFRAPHSLEG